MRLTPMEKLVPNSGLLLEKTPSAALSRMMRTGILARSVEDLKTVLKVISGPDEKESDVISIKKLPDPEKRAERLRLAWTVNAGGLAVSEETAGIIKGLAEKLSASGHVVDCLPDGRFDFKTSRDVFLRIFYASVSASMPLPAVFVMRRLLGAKYFDTSLKRYLKAETERLELINSMEGIFSDYDALLCPITATPAFPHIKPDRCTRMGPVYKKGIDVDGKNINYAEANMGFTIPFSVTGNPVAVLPAGLSGDGLPIGVQVVGRRYDDLRLLEIAAALSEEAGPIGHPKLK
jgi:amidase